MILDTTMEQTTRRRTKKRNSGHRWKWRKLNIMAVNLLINKYNTRPGMLQILNIKLENIEIKKNP